MEVHYDARINSKMISSDEKQLSSTDGKQEYLTNTVSTMVMYKINKYLSY